jgi:hypothetical protein
MEKLGAKRIYHKIFSWVQFQHSMMKSDLGLIEFILVTGFIFDNSNVIILICDILAFIIFIAIVIVMRKSVL